MDIGVPSGRLIGGRCVVLLMSFPAFCRSCHATSRRNRYSKWFFVVNSSFQWALTTHLMGCAYHQFTGGSSLLVVLTTYLGSMS